MRPLATYSVGPDGNAWQIGVEGSDVVGRLGWVAMGSVGNDAGPRGASLAAAYRGLPITISAHAFLAREKPGSQRVVRRPEFDQERVGGFLDASWSRPFSGGRLRIDAGGGSSRVEPLAGDDDFSRSLVSIRTRAGARRVRGKSGFGLDADVSGSPLWNKDLAPTTPEQRTWTDPALGRVLFRDWLGEWWATTTNLRPTTRERNETLLRRYALPHFGDVALVAISQRDVRAWVADLSGRGLAPATVQKAYQLLGKVLGAAVDAGMIAQNPCRRVPLPRIERREMRFLTPAEVARLADSIRPSRRALVLLGA